MNPISRNLLLLAMAWGMMESTKALTDETHAVRPHDNKETPKYFASEDDFKTPAVATNERTVSSRIIFVRGQLRKTVWCVTREVLERQPRWDGLTAEPPLSVQKAVAMALPNAKRRFPEVKEWCVQTIYLRNGHIEDDFAKVSTYRNIWAYEITFVPKDLKVSEDIDEEILRGQTEVVLLDGTVVPPRTVK